MWDHMMWDHTWVSSIDTFKYTDKKMSHGGKHPAPDLNLFIVPLYGWLYKMTGDDKYRERPAPSGVGASGSSQAKASNATLPRTKLSY
jgi:hypothetical protein